MALRNARVDLKTTSDAKTLLERAACIVGTTLSAFILESSLTHARQVLAESQLIQLNAVETERFIRAIENPPEPNSKLKSLFTKNTPKKDIK
jgi:uncharacterized protein (DUF1778 family)